MDRCLNCSGAIGEQGKSYGYAGKWCQCPVNPARHFQRPASKEIAQKHPFIMTEYERQQLSELTKLRKQLEVARGALEKICRGHSDILTMPCCEAIKRIDEIGAGK